jgi:precorrin-2 dehydrogenase/sirohydrochlorin ferrochelatase
MKLAARPCVVVGAGTIAESKIESLLLAEASVRVIAPDALPRVREWAESGQLTWLQREYVQGDLHGAFLVVAATATAAVNRAVYAEATAAKILCNAVDDPPFCDYYFPSIVRRGELQIAISTAGESPALAQRLRKEINAALPLDMGEWLMELGRLRREVTAVEPIGEARKSLLHGLASREVCGYDLCPSRLRAREHAQEFGVQATGDPMMRPTAESMEIASRPASVNGALLQELTSERRVMENPMHTSISRRGGWIAAGLAVAGLIATGVATGTRRTHGLHDELDLEFAEESVL